MSRDSRALGGNLLRFPRVSGDEPPPTDWRADRRVFSPRERG